MSFSPARAIPASCRFTIIRLLALLALGLSGALLLHYLAPRASGFCGPSSGCEAARQAAPRIFGGTYLLPLLGMGGHALLFWLTFFGDSGWVRGALRLGGGVAALTGAALLLYQGLALSAFCSWCVWVDVVAVILGSLCLVWAREPPFRPEPVRGWAWFALLAVAINAPKVWSELRPSPGLPESIAVLSKPGVLNVIEFVDFQCPHCRRLHTTLRDSLAPLGDQVNLRRFHVPLKLHPHASSAALAALCAEQQGHGKQMADALFAHALGRDNVARHARALQLDLNSFQRCLESPETQQELNRHEQLYRSTGSTRLPLTFVGNRRLEGAVSVDVLQQAIAEATTQSSFRLSAAQFIALLAGVSALVLLLGRRRDVRVR